MNERAVVKQQQKNLERIARLRLMDDNFLSICMTDNIKGAQLIVRIILEDESIQVKRVETQKEYKNLSEHSFCFDVYAEDGKGRNIEIEVQRNSAGADPKRAACHSGVLDANSMPKNEQDYRKKAETYTIFITEKDILKGNLPIYHVARKIEEMPEQDFEDGSHIIYVNGAFREDESTPLGWLVHDFFCTDPDEMHYEELAERARYFKKDGEGVRRMCEIWEEVLQEGVEQGEKKGRLENISKNVQILMKKKGWSLEETLDVLDVSPEDRLQIVSLL